MFLSSPPADLAGRVSVNFFEHAAEKFVIGKSVLVEHLQDRFVCRTDVMVDVGEPHVVDVLREGNADVLPEHAAEIVAVETEDICYLLKGQRLHIVLVDIGNDLLDPELIAARLGEIFWYREVGDQPVENIQRDRLGCDHIPLGLPDMELHQFLEAFADLQVSGDQLVRQFRTAAYDLEIAPVPHEPLNEVVVDAQDDHHVGVGTAGLMDLVGVDHDEFAGNQLVLASLQIDGRISVQYVDKFQGIMPMGRCVFPGCPIFHQDPVFGDIVVLKIDVVRHIGPSHLFVPIYHFRWGSARTIRTRNAAEMNLNHEHSVF